MKPFTNVAALIKLIESSWPSLEPVGSSSFCLKSGYSETIILMKRVREHGRFRLEFTPWLCKALKGLKGLKRPKNLKRPKIRRPKNALMYLRRPTTLVCKNSVRTNDLKTLYLFSKL